jgi:hypothetical protein
MAGFQMITYGRIWVFTEGIVNENVGIGGTKLVIVEVDCSGCPPCP